jgi:serine phosphatase RsbU (regulator of sigma subunit)
MTEDDLLLLYTDGLVEARNAKNEEFGEGRLFDFIKENNMEPAQTFLDKLEQIVISHAGRLQDDLTLVVVKR